MCANSSGQNLQNAVNAALCDYILLRFLKGDRERESITYSFSFLLFFSRREIAYCLEKLFDLRTVAAEPSSSRLNELRESYRGRAAL